MRAVAKTTWVELKLFVREPLTAVFTLAVPLVFLFVLGGVFGNAPSPEVFRGVGPMDYYVPAYIGLVAASLGLIGLPSHLAAYRERGILRRYRASSVPLWSVFGGQVAVTVVIASVSSVILVAVAALTYDVGAPEHVLQVLAALLLAAVTFAALGLLLGTVLPTARAAQGAGVLLWFVMLIIAGAGPPPEVLTDAMRTVADVTPLRHVILVLQDPWLGFGWPWGNTLVAGAYLVGAAVVTVLLLRRG